MDKVQRENNSKPEYTERPSQPKLRLDRYKFRHTEVFASEDNHPDENSSKENYAFGGEADFHYQVKVCVGRMPTHLHASMLI